MSNIISKEFLEKHLNQWSEDVSLQDKWKSRVTEYKNKQAELTKQLKEIKNIFSKEDIELFNSKKFENYMKQSQEGSIDFFTIFENHEMVSKFFSDNYFNSVIEDYDGTYIYDNLKRAQHAYIENLDLDFNFSDEEFNLYFPGQMKTNEMESFHRVGRFKKGRDNQSLKHNDNQSKGAMLQYLIIEYLHATEKSIDKNKLIQFYDLSIKILWTPHSIKNAMGLHFNVNNNNFLLQLLEFYKKITDFNNTEWSSCLNAKWPTGNNKVFHKFNTNSVIELFSWIHLGKSAEDSIVSIYNDKTISTLYILMGKGIKKEKVLYTDFYKVYKSYMNKNKPYPKDEENALNQVLFADQFFQYIHELKINEMNLFKNVIYHGAPGTGKTWELKEEIKNYLELFDNSKSEFIQFHSSYYYEDFIGGLKPNPKSPNGLSLEFRNGIFKELCKEAGRYEVAYYNSDDYKNKESKVKFLVDEIEFEINRKKPDFSSFPPYFILIDEINRADLSKVFGELLFAIEDDYRGYENRFKLSTSLMEDDSTAVCYENEEALFFVPQNLYIRGTMNDIDRSVDSIDFAFRRRFKWVEKNYDSKKIEEILKQKTIIIDELDKFRKSCDNLNKEILNISIADKSYQIGHAIFANISKYIKSKKITKESKEKLFDNHIEPIIYNYLKMDYGNEGSDIKKFRDEFVK